MLLSKNMLTFWVVVPIDVQRHRRHSSKQFRKHVSDVTCAHRAVQTPNVDRVSRGILHWSVLTVSDGERNHLNLQQCRIVSDFRRCDTIVTWL